MINSGLKHNWDNKNVLDYAVSTAEAKGRREEALTIAREMKKERLTIVQISKFTQLPVEEIESLSI